MNNPGLDSFPVATIYEATTKAHILPQRIRPVQNGMKICGPVFTAALRSGNNYNLHSAIYEAPSGSVIVASVEGPGDFGYWGEILTHAAKMRGIQGLIIDGCIRDRRQICDLNFPVFCTGLCVRGTTKEIDPSFRTALPIRICEVTVHSGDMAVGDCDGVIVIPQDIWPESVKAAQSREEQEAEVIESLKKGKTTIELFKLNEKKN